MSVNGVNSSHYREINQHYAEECSQDDIGSFLFTSESVGEGHPGTVISTMSARRPCKERALVRPPCLTMRCLFINGKARGSVYRQYRFGDQIN